MLSDFFLGAARSTAASATNKRITPNQLEAYQAGCNQIAEKKGSDRMTQSKKEGRDSFRDKLKQAKWKAEELIQRYTNTMTKK